jgi:EAL domain-containing protein (putative c-di-GMP-specific phosphodiesterase class I)
VALAAAKTSGSGAIRQYIPELDDRIRNKVALEQGLHMALEEQQFDLHFQPIVDLATSRIVGAEALIRWMHPTLGLQRPDQFIPLAEATGQIVPLGAWVLEEALRSLRKWQDQGGEIPRISINVSGVQLRHPDFFDFAVAAIAKSGVDPSKLELELTETAMVDCTPEILGRLAKVRELGVTVALDDFGTGYSSFRYLHNLPIDKI